MNIYKETVLTRWWIHKHTELNDKDYPVTKDLISMSYLSEWIDYTLALRKPITNPRPLYLEIDKKVAKRKEKWHDNYYVVGLFGDCSSDCPLCPVFLGLAFDWEGEEQDFRDWIRKKQEAGEWQFDGNLEELITNKISIRSRAHGWSAKNLLEQVRNHHEQEIYHTIQPAPTKSWWVTKPLGGAL